MLSARGAEPSAPGAALRPSVYAGLKPGAGARRTGRLPIETTSTGRHIHGALLFPGALRALNAERVGAVLRVPKPAVQLSLVGPRQGRGPHRRSLHLSTIFETRHVTHVRSVTKIHGTSTDSQTTVSRVKRGATQQVVMT